MAIDMSTVKSIEFNNKQVKKIEDSNGNVLWSFAILPTSTKHKAMCYKIRGMTYNQSGYTVGYIKYDSTKFISVAGLRNATLFYIFTQNQLLSMINGLYPANGVLNSENIGSYDSVNDIFTYNSNTIDDSSGDSAKYICFIKNNRIYCMGTNKIANMNIESTSASYYNNANKLKLKFVKGYYQSDRYLVDENNEYFLSITGYAGQNQDIVWKRVADATVYNGLYIELISDVVRELPGV